MASWFAPGQANGPGRRPAEPVGALDDGTPVYARFGTMEADGDRVCCHLCGSWFLSVASHIRVHGWSRAEYIATFGLQLGNPLSGEATRKRRAAALTARALTEPAIRQAQKAARERTRSGQLAAAASAAARGRPHPAERRTKTLASLSAITREARAIGGREAARRRHAQTAAKIAARFGFADFPAYVLDRLRQSMSLAAISREAGLHKDWLSRHLKTVAPDIADRRKVLRTAPHDRRLDPAARRLGYTDVGSYLRGEHLDRHRTVAALANHAGVSRWTIITALQRNGIQPVPHVTKRRTAEHRSTTVARALGDVSLGSYVRQRRAQGSTWKTIVRETGLPETTLRRHSRTTMSR
jgi:lambda repressor-like predicted transcriptional regulator